VRGVAAVLENKPKIVSHSVTPNASALQPTKITIDDNYADQVQVKDIIDKMTTHIAWYRSWQCLVFHDIYSVKDSGFRPNWNFTTNVNGSFEDQIHFNYLGTYILTYFFHGDDQYAPCHSEAIAITML